MMKRPGSNAASRLGLGTVQFGMDYGISGSGGAVVEEEATRILALARRASITTLDTAPGYGASENILGRLVGASGDFSIISKIPSLKSHAAVGDKLKAARDSFGRTLNTLQRDRIHGLLLHDASDLMGDGARELNELMQQWKQAGKVGKIGVSIYETFEAERIMQDFPLDLIQLPISIFDQRLLEAGVLAALKQADVEIHARSIFLQGLVFMCENTLPPHLEAAKPLLAGFRDATRRAGVSPLQAAMAFILDQPMIDRAIIGVHSAAHLAECVAAATATTQIEMDFSEFACLQTEIMDPRQWARSD